MEQDKPTEGWQGAWQEFPFPDALARVVESATYRPGWTFKLKYMDRGQGSGGLTLVVRSQGYDTYHPERGETYGVLHYMPVPPAAFDERQWRRWLLDRLVEIETQEACEFLVIDGRRPFAPNHGPGRDPYVIVEVGTVEDAETRSTGERREGTQGVSA